MATNVSWNQPGQIISRKAEAVTSAYRIIVNGTNDDQAQQASGTGTAFLGISIPGSGPDPSGMAEVGDTFDIALGGVVAVKYGDTVAKDDQLTSDSVGRAITASSGHFLIGIAQTAGVLNDLGSCLIDKQEKP